MRFTRLACAAAIACLAGSAPADLLVCDFENTATEIRSEWENVPWGGVNGATFYPGSGTATRSLGAFSFGVSRKWGHVPASNPTGHASKAFKYGSPVPPSAIVEFPPYSWPTVTDAYTAWTSQLPASTHGTTAQKLQSIGWTLGSAALLSSNPLNVDSAGTDPKNARYVRATAWVDSAANIPASSAFIFSILANTTGNMSIGPWDATGTTLAGFSIGTTPTAFLLDMNDSTRFKIDPVYDAVMGGIPASFGSNAADKQNVIGFSFGYRREGAAANATMDGLFYIDDIMLLTDAPAFEFSSTGPFSIAEGGANATFDVNLAAMPAQNVVLDLTNAFGTDINVSPATLTFTGGNSGNWATPQTVTISAIADAVYEGSETNASAITFSRANSVDLYYKNSADTALVSSIPSAISVTVTDTPPTINFSTAPGATLGEPLGGTLIDVSLNIASDIPVSVDVAPGAGSTASTPADYTISPTTLNFGPAQTVAQVMVTLADDDIDEDNESVVLELSNPVVGTLGATTSYTVTLTDNDTAGLVLSSIDATTSEAGATGGYSVALASQPTADITIASVSGDATEGSVTSADLTFNSSNWATPQAVSVAGIDDAIRDGDVAYNVTATASGDPKYAALAPVDTPFTNADDEGDPIIQVPVSASFDDNAGATFLSIPLSLPSAFIATVDYQFVDGTAVNGTHFTGANGTLTYGALDTVESIPVTLIDTAGGPRQFTINFLNASNATLSAASVPVTINDITSVKDWTILQ